MAQITINVDDETLRIWNHVVAIYDGLAKVYKEPLPRQMIETAAFTDILYSFGDKLADDVEENIHLTPEQEALVNERVAKELGE